MSQAGNSCYSNHQLNCTTELPGNLEQQGFKQGEGFNRAKHRREQMHRVILLAPGPH